jgi:phosphonate transport system permease protein
MLGRRLGCGLCACGLAHRGAAPAQVPQIQPTFVGVSVFRWDINIRESTVVGLVGAGGIGLNLEASLNTLAWAQVSLILLVIFGTVVLSEWTSAKVHHAINLRRLK